MKCPHCQEAVALAPMVRVAWRKKRCPACHKPVKLYLSFLAATWLTLPLSLLGFALLPVFMSYAWAGLAFSVSSNLAWAWLSMRLKPRIENTTTIVYAPATKTIAVHASKP